MGKITQASGLLDGPVKTKGAVFTKLYASLSGCAYCL